MYSLDEFCIALLVIGVFRNGFPKVGGVDVDKSTCMLFLLGQIGDTSATECKIEIGKVTSKFSRLVRIEARRRSISARGHRNGRYIHGWSDG